MDNLTHTLTGLLLSRAGLNRFHPMALPILLISANVPDFDAVSLLGGASNYLHYHRWITHSLLALPVMAILPPLLVRMAARKRPFPWLSAWAISMVGVASHLLLDWTNSYGIRLFLPFNDEWPGLSITGVVDIWIWAILLLAVFAPMLGRLVSAEIGAKKTSGQGWAIAALVLIALYDSGRAVLHRHAIEVQEARMYNGETPRRTLAYPDRMNPMVWRGIVETGAFFVIQTVNLAQGFDSAEHRIVFKPESSPAIEAAAKTPEFQRLAAFSRALHWHSTPASEVEGATRVEASDLFFGFTASALVDSRNQVQSTSFRFR